MLCAGCRSGGFEAETTTSTEPTSVTGESLSAGSTVPASAPPTETEAVSTTAPQETTAPTTTSITTEAPTTVLFGSMDCFEVDESDGPYSPVRDPEREFPLNLAGITALNYYFPYPDDFVPDYGWYTFLYSGYTFSKSSYYDFFTSIGNPELFDDKFSYIGTRAEVGRNFDPSSVRKISIGDKIGGFIVEDATFAIKAHFIQGRSHGVYDTCPQSAYVKLSGSVTLKGIAVKKTNICFYVYTDSIRETEFPFLNMGSRGFSISADGIGLYAEDPTLCFLLDETTIDFGDRSFCEAEITFTDIEQSWDRDHKSAFCLCTAQKAEVKILGA